MLFGFGENRKLQAGSARGGPDRSTLAMGLCVLAASAIVISGCAAAKKKVAEIVPSHINTKTKFSVKEFGVKGSPRVTMTKRPRKGGGRYQVGKPYMIAGKRYYPKEDPNLVQVGMASWYGPNFHGRLTANGEIYDQYSLTAAHPTMPLPSYAKVTNLNNGRSLLVRVNDRGPYAHGRVIDLSAKAAELLGYQNKGVTKVRVEYAGKARMDGLDEDYLMASYVDPAKPSFPGFGNSSDTMLAMADTGEGEALGATIPAANGPASAIEAVAPAYQGTTLAMIPIPDERPTLFEGLPMDIGTTGADQNAWPEEQIYRVVRQPLAFTNAELPDLAAHLEKALEERPYLGQHANTSVDVELGRFARDTSMGELATIFASAGRVEIDEDTRIAVLHTTEQYANAAIGFAIEQGLHGARIR